MSSPRPELCVGHGTADTLPVMGLYLKREQEKGESDILFDKICPSGFYILQADLNLWVTSSLAQRRPYMSMLTMKKTVR